MPAVRSVLVALGVLALAPWACGDSVERDEDAGARLDAGSGDSGRAADGGPAPDGASDGGGGTADSGTERDAAMGGDAGGAGECPAYTPPPAGTTPCRTVEECPAGTPFGPVSCVPTDYVPPPLCGGPAPPPSCATDADCASLGGGFWVRCGPNPRPGCGGPLACLPPCGSDAECGAGERCLPTGLCEALSCPDPYSCAAGERCDATAATADAHGCAPIPCSDGYACPAGWVCDPMPDPHIIPDAHGCRPMTCGETGTCPLNARCEATPAGYMCQRLGCDRDDECDCGACVSHNCVAGPGYCYVQPPPPP